MIARTMSSESEFRAAGRFKMMNPVWLITSLNTCSVMAGHRKNDSKKRARCALFYVGLFEENSGRFGGGPVKSFDALMLVILDFIFMLENLSVQLVYQAINGRIQILGFAFAMQILAR